ncbi:MAG: hypothetical protein MUO34_13625, partial [Ignavibacteriaceae bacterium]|nr:hypothetical protein [Ignavibacteriaceae bacterium]
MEKFKSSYKYFFLLISLGLMFFISCSEEFPDQPQGNLPPETGMFLYPDSTVSQQLSRLRVHWWGDDPDGLVIGYYFIWEGIDTKWTFTTKNDSTFSLPIGTSDTTYRFLVSAVDAQGNGKYDSKIFQNGIDFGPEPFVDGNNNGVFDNGETYYDLGLIDPTPASTLFPIKNSSPVLSWNELSFLPDTSFPVITIAWNASDLDGDESITEIQIALNDTNNFVSIPGSVRLVTLRGINLDDQNPEVEILINASPQNVHSEKLLGLVLNGNNKIFIRASDLSGASSDIIQLPDTSSMWYVQKPKGEVLIFDDLRSSTSDIVAAQFYNQIFSTMNDSALAGKFDVFDLANNSVAFESVTILETLKLFKYIFWYAGSNPRLDLLNIITEKFTQANGKIAFSMTFQASSSTFLFDLSSLQGFLPIDSVSGILGNGYLLLGADVVPSPENDFDFPALETSVTIAFARSYTPNSIIAENIYDLYDRDGIALGNIAFRTTSKNLFFIGLPLHQCNGGPANVPALLTKIF